MDGDRSTQTVLVVDDHPEVLQVTTLLLELMGYRTLAVNSGCKALALLRNVSAVDILFTDIRMPVMDGVALGFEAKKMRPKLRVVLVTGYAADILDNYGSLPFPVLHKPYFQKDLVRVLGQAH